MILAKDQDKIQVIDKLSGLKYPDQLGEAKALCTAQGDSFVQTMVSDMGGFLASSFVVTKVKTSGTTCDVEMRRDLSDGNSHISIRLINQNGWKFHDVLVVEWNGKKRGQNGIWLSYAVEHPWMSTAEIHSDDLKKGYDQAKDFLKFMGDLEKLFPSNEQDQKIQDSQAVNKNLF